MTEHLGYEKGSPDASAFPNSRNGSTPKTVGTQVGEVDLEVPRDREGSSTPRLVPKGSLRLGVLDEILISLCAGGMTVAGHRLPPRVHAGHRTVPRDDQPHHRPDRRGGPGLAGRPLDALYPVIYLDAIVVKVRDGAHVANKAAHIAVGVDIDGVKHVLRIWLQTTEGAKFWAGVAPSCPTAGSATCSSSAATA